MNIKGQKHAYIQTPTVALHYSLFSICEKYVSVSPITSDTLSRVTLVFSFLFVEKKKKICSPLSHKLFILLNTNILKLRVLSDAHTEGCDGFLCSQTFCYVLTPVQGEISAQQRSHYWEPHLTLYSLELHIFVHSVNACAAAFGCAYLYCSYNRTETCNLHADQ